MDTLLRRENAFVLFCRLNSAILNNYVELKNQLKEQAPPNHLIITTLKTWKDPLTKTIDRQILKMLNSDEMPPGMTQSQVLAGIVDCYKEEQQFIELFRCLNSSIETVKDFIRITAVKDNSKEGLLG